MVWKSFPMYTCRFIIGWMHESDGACGESTGIYTLDDLIAAANGDESKDQFSVFVYEAPYDYAYEVGAEKAFKENWTAQDSLSVVQVQNEKGEWVETLE